jgi:deoxyribose-phosphate aldolase
MHQAIKDGADELDMVINISALKSDMIWPKIEVAKLGKIAHENGKILKVIIETAYLHENEIVALCKISADAGADFVKTSTGFASGGATKHAVQLMKENIGKNVRIKASGGIRDAATAKEYIELGVSRIGTSSGVAIVEGTASNSSY